MAARRRSLRTAEDGPGAVDSNGVNMDQYTVGHCRMPQWFSVRPQWFASPKAQCSELGWLSEAFDPGCVERATIPSPPLGTCKQAAQRDSTNAGACSERGQVAAASTRSGFSSNKAV